MKRDGPMNSDDTTDKSESKNFLEKTVLSEEKLPTTLEIQSPEISADITQFFQRIKTNTTRVNVIADELSRFILPNDLAKIYEHVLDNQESLQKSIMNGKSIRLAKEKTGLKRTLNIVRHPIDGGQVALILEIKSKTADGDKNSFTPRFGGTVKNGTHALRIDTEKPQKWVNLVMRKNVNENIPEEDDSLKNAIKLVRKEVNIAKKMNKKSKIIEKELGYPLFQAYSLGEQFYKPSAGIKTLKISLYSPCAIGSLYDIIRNKEQYNNLTEEDKNNIILSLLKGVKVLHENNIIHQDIKTQNILIYKKENGGYYATLCDFGTVNNKLVVATYGYESPEISKIYRDINSSLHTYFHKSSFLSYGKYIANEDQSAISSILSFLTPHTSNDMWALGMVLNELLSRTAPYVGDNPETALIVKDNKKLLELFEKRISTNPLLAGLLNPQREQRFTANDAIEAFEKRANYKMK